MTQQQTDLLNIYIKQVYYERTMQWVASDGRTEDGLWLDMANSLSSIGRNSTKSFSVNDWKKMGAELTAELDQGASTSQESRNSIEVSQSYDEVLVDDCKSNTQEYLPSTPPTCGLKLVAGENMMLAKDSNTVMVKQEKYKAACHGSSSYTGVSKVPEKKLMLARGRNSVKVEQEVCEAASRPNRSYTGVSKKVGGQRMMEHQPLLSYDKIKPIFAEVLAEVGLHFQRMNHIFFLNKYRWI
ncbi:hypothetical protein QAD02_018523 [Eretmocerus hayati]|uniref:Uncharacterized protein n=1 Tax=Eretmocerus hayati TaxID=131215 RepID=A0ACC2PH07_9HYME|nr:hypothetical protein QAD02_018523 [Eretmocerus hayati]